MINRRAIAVLLVLVVAAGAALFGWRSYLGQQSDRVVVRYGVTPYQDTALPVVAKELKWYGSGNTKYDVEIVSLGWGEIPVALASGSIDVAVYNFNSFIAPWQNIKDGGKELVFYAPLYVFNGNAIMVKQAAGMEVAAPGSSKEKLKSVISQLKGKRIAVTKGTELEQIVLSALQLAGLNPTTDVQLIQSRPEDALAAFISGDIDAFAAGLTERVEAKRRGGVELLVGGDLDTPVIDGLVTRADFAAKHPAVLNDLVDNWFRTIQFVGGDLKNNSKYVLAYLKDRASTRYTEQEYEVAWTFQNFPVNRDGANKLFNESSSAYYWKTIWQKINDFLVSQKQIKSAVPESAYWGARTLSN